MKQSDDEKKNFFFYCADLFNNVIKEIKINALNFCI